MQNISSTYPISESLIALIEVSFVCFSGQGNILYGMEIIFRQAQTNTHGIKHNDRRF